MSTIRHAVLTAQASVDARLRNRPGMKDAIRNARDAEQLPRRIATPTGHRRIGNEGRRCLPDEIVLT